MYTILAFDGTELTKDKQPTKVRIARTFKRHDQTMTDINNEMKLLSPEELAWFKSEYEAAGYPCT